ncbi:MAG: carboxymuconolactone decarboxylase family protein [Burkholderiales bacterium]
MPALPPERLPHISQEHWTEEQKKVAAAIASGPRGEVRGPFLALLRSPGLAHTVQQVGEYLRFKCPLDRRIAEMATLMAARHWTQQYEWQSHYKHAMKAGLSPAIAHAIAEGRRPAGMAADEEALHELLTEVFHNKSACDETYRRAVKVFGEQGVIELIAVAGYYAMLAMILNVARKELPAGQEPMLPWFPH